MFDKILKDFEICGKLLSYSKFMDLYKPVKLFNAWNRDNR